MTQARAATPTVTFIDEYCQLYQEVFPDVRSFEHFKQIQIGMLAEIKRKTLPAIAHTVRDGDPQALHHLVAYAPWHVEQLRDTRLTLLKHALAGRTFTLCIDETGDKKKGKTTAYVAHQYIGNLGKLENGIVSVNAYGVLDQMTFPLLFKVYKPHTRLLADDTYKTKPQLAIELIKELRARGFQFDLVLADSLYGESTEFLEALEELHLKYVLAIRSNHGMWLPPGQRVRLTRWRPFERTFSNGEQQTRFICEIIYGQRQRIRFYILTTDPKTLPKEGTWYLMTNLEGKIEKSLGDTYGLRTWIEYGFKQTKNELGWADYRVTDYASIERWWELVFCADTLVSFQCPALQTETQGSEASPGADLVERFPQHRWWDTGHGWKNVLNNLRLILQPYVYSCLLLPWLLVFNIPCLHTGFAELTGIMNWFHARLPI